MHVKPVRYQSQGCLPFITFSCYQRMKLLDSVAARDTFEQELERVRRWYGSFVTGYVVMPEHVHLLLSEPERGKLSLFIQTLKQITSRKLKPPGQPRFWQVRYYDFPVWSEAKRIEKLRYIPVPTSLSIQKSKSRDRDRGSLASQVEWFIFHQRRHYCPTERCYPKGRYCPKAHSSPTTRWCPRARWIPTAHSSPREHCCPIRCSS